MYGRTMPPRWARRGPARGRGWHTPKSVQLGGLVLLGCLILAFASYGWRAVAALAAFVLLTVLGWWTDDLKGRRYDRQHPRR